MSKEIKPGFSTNIATKSGSKRFFFNNTLLVMGATLASRILGFGRDIVLANRFGTNSDVDAYQAAFRIPDTLYLLIIGGALGSSLIPVFSRFLGQQQPAKAWRLANTVINYASLVLVVASILAWIFAPFLVTTILAPKFKPPVQALTIDLTRILMFQPFFMGLGGIALALLNGSEKFVWPALAPLVYNLSIIGGILFLAPIAGIYGVAYGVVIGAVLYLLVQLPGLFKLGFYWKPGLDREAEGAGPVLRALGPRLLGAAAFQANFFVATNLASGLGTGRNSSFGFGYQLFMLPHGIFAISLATVSFPQMARLLGANDQPGMKRVLAGALRQVLFLALPAAVGLALLAQPIIKTLYQRGEFGATSTDLVSETLICFSFGLVSYGVVEIVTRAFYALNDTRTPVSIALATVALNIGLSIGLVGPLYQGGLALALALSTTFEMVMLIYFLRRKIGPLSEGVALLTPFGKMATAAGAMGLVLWGLRQFLQPAINSNNGPVLWVLTGALIGAGGLTYAVVAYLLRIEELQSVVQRFLKRVR